MTDSQQTTQAVAEGVTGGFGAAIDGAIAGFRQTLESEGLTRAALEHVLQQLQALAARKELWTAAHFPDPAEDVSQVRYFIREDEATGFSLYLNVLRPGKLVPPHNHTTWACIAAVEGTEHNHVYERLDDASVAGRAQLRKSHTVIVDGDTGIAMMPEDIHAVQVSGERIIRHLHMYGRALEKLDARHGFDLEAGTCKIVGVPVASTRIALPA